VDRGGKGKKTDQFFENTEKNKKTS
jgi:hypothetical protein